jgi:hypothetical protein
MAPLTAWQGFQVVEVEADSATCHRLWQLLKDVHTVHQWVRRPSPIQLEESPTATTDLSKEMVGGSIFAAAQRLCAAQAHYIWCDSQAYRPILPRTFRWSFFMVMSS